VSRYLAGLLVLAVIAAAVSALAPGLFGGADAPVVARDAAVVGETGGTVDTTPSPVVDVPGTPGALPGDGDSAVEIPGDIAQMTDVDLAVAWLTADTELFADQPDAVADAIAADGDRSAEGASGRASLDILGSAIRERGGPQVAGVYSLVASTDCAVLGEMPFGDRVRLTQTGFMLRFTEDVTADGADPQAAMGIAGAAVGETVVVGDPGVGVVLHGPAHADGVTLQLDTVRFRETATMPLPPEEFAAIQRCRLTLKRLSAAGE